MMASNFLDSARVRAAEGTSQAPGTRTISMSCFAAPLRCKASSEPWRRRSVMTVFQRVVTGGPFLMGGVLLLGRRASAKVGWKVGGRAVGNFGLAAGGGKEAPRPWASCQPLPCSNPRAEKRLVRRSNSAPGAPEEATG